MDQWKHYALLVKIQIGIHSVDVNLALSLKFEDTHAILSSKFIYWHFYVIKKKTQKTAQ